jgi:hypothetical protein
MAPIVVTLSVGREEYNPKKTTICCPLYQTTMYILLCKHRTEQGGREHTLTSAQTLVRDTVPRKVATTVLFPQAMIALVSPAFSCTTLYRWRPYSDIATPSEVVAPVVFGFSCKYTFLLCSAQSGVLFRFNNPSHIRYIPVDTHFPSAVLNLGYYSVLKFQLTYGIFCSYVVCTSWMVKI